MSNSITIYLDTVRKYRNKQEYRPVNRARTTYNGQYYEAVGDGDVERNLLSMLRDDKCPIDAQVHVLRDALPCYEPMPLYRWLGLDKDGNKLDRRPKQLRKDK